MEDFDSLIALADASMDAQQFETALRHAARAVELDPARAVGHYKKAVAHQALWQLAEAEAGYLRALAIDPALGRALNNLGCLYLYRDDRRAAMDAFRRAIAADATIAEPHSNLGLQLLGTPDAAQAPECFRRAIAIEPGYADAHLNLSQCLLDMGRTAEAEESYRQALALGPRAPELRLVLMLPSMMESREAIAGARDRLAQRLERLAAREPQIADPIAAVRESRWFYLAYHGLDDRPLVSAIASLFARACPSLSFSAAHCAEPRRDGPRLRIGFVSAHLREHTIGKMFSGVIARLPRERFEVTLFAPEHPPDSVVGFLRRHVAAAVTLAPSLQTARKQIAAHALDILFYPDIGMDLFTYFLAFSRLARVQCASWGHPMTSGIPAIDHFVSHADCELPGSERHYTEQLLCLPAGDALTYYYRPDTAGLSKTRRDFGLPDSSTIYFCPQNLVKLHPDQDAAFRDILAADPGGLLVLLEGEKPLFKEVLLRRLERILPRELARVRFLPQQPYRDFLNLARLSDVVLDSFVFSGGNSSFELFAAGCPIVTLPSDQMRGRVTLTCCRRMEMVEELVAADAADYCAKVLRLGTERDYREHVKSRLAQRADRLFEDGGVVLHLAELLQAACERRY